MVITRAKNRSPDMILTVFDMKTHEKNNKIPPRARRPLTKFKQIKQSKQMQEKKGPAPAPARPPPGNRKNRGISLGSRPPY